MRPQTSPRSDQAGFSLPELLVVTALLGIVIALALPSGREAVAREQVEAATRSLLEGIQRGRAEAERTAAACGLSLGEEGWEPPLEGELPACDTGLGALRPLGGGGVQWRHNLPATLRFTATGLVLDGGTVVLEAPGTTVRRCVVMALPLGVVRVGRAVGGASLASAQCRPEAVRP